MNGSPTQGEGLALVEGRPLARPSRAVRRGRDQVAPARGPSERGSRTLPPLRRWAARSPTAARFAGALGTAANG